ncbi:hypothetical protein MUK42_23525 [Musa troglodytarum]|uniref:Uncharacterized protein n=1 Tax=Musa troglodytarum TaxID=320322 RepID=A0A9E7K6Y2_9LILI|nr:hypothetical protein MUK42_23525 [Musa troglodytarum]
MKLHNSRMSCMAFSKWRLPDNSHTGVSETQITISKLSQTLLSIYQLANSYWPMAHGSCKCGMGMVHFGKYSWTWPRPTSRDNGMKLLFFFIAASPSSLTPQQHLSTFSHGRQRERKRDTGESQHP